MTRFLNLDRWCRLLPYKARFSAALGWKKKGAGTLWKGSILPIVPLDINQAIPFGDASRCHGPARHASQRTHRHRRGGRVQRRSRCLTVRRHVGRKQRTFSVGCWWQVTGSTASHQSQPSRSNSGVFAKLPQARVDQKPLMLKRPLSDNQCSVQTNLQYICSI